MNKLSLLTFALVIVLPGCGGSKNQSSSNNVAKYMAVDSSVEEIEDTDDEEDDDEDEEEEEEIEEDEFDLGEEEEEEEVGDEWPTAEELAELEALVGQEDQDIEVDIEEQENEEAFRWIDAQDDEFKTLYFSFNHYGVRPDQKAAVAYDIEQVKQLLADSDTSAQPMVVIEGHACQEGSPAYNVALSEKRAKNVADLFVASGIDRSVIKVVGRGQECPAVINGRVVNGSREDRAPNRRVEVRVMYT